MTKQQISTIILQEDRIRELEKRNKELETGYHQVWKENEKLRKKMKKGRQENELNRVNI